MTSLTPKKRNKVIDDVLKAVRKGKTFLLSGHHKPDGDTVGSELAFASFLRRLGKKKVDVINAESVPAHLMFLPGADKIQARAKVEGRYDVCVVFECSGADRMGNIIDLDRQVGTVVNIDHHAHHNFFGDINLINPKASSNSEQLFYFFERAKLKITREEAASLYVGLVTDTGRFQYDSVNPDTHRVAAGLHEAGVDAADICRRLFATRSEPAVRILGRGLTSLRLEAGGRIAVMTVSEEDFRQTASTPEDTDEVVNHGLLIPSVEASIFVRADGEGRTKVSFRGKGRVDLCRVAVSFDGGGHKNASGCSLPGSVGEVAGKMVSAVAAALPRPQ